MKLSHANLFIVSQSLWDGAFFVVTKELYGEKAAAWFVQSMNECGQLYFKSVYHDYIEAHLEEQDFLQLQNHPDLLTTIQSPQQSLSSMVGERDAEEGEVIAQEIFKTFLFFPRILGEIFHLSLPQLFRRSESMPLSDSSALDFSRNFFQSNNQRREWKKSVREHFLSLDTILGYQRIIKGFGITETLEIGKTRQVEEVLTNLVIPQMQVF